MTFKHVVLPMSNTTIYVGDALALIPTLARASVNLVVTSPPYPGQYGNDLSPGDWLRWTHDWLWILRSRLAPNAVIALNVQFKRNMRGWYDHLILQLGNPVWLGNYNVLDLYIYGKSNPPPNGPLTYCDPPGWEFVFILTNAERPQDVTFNPVRRAYSSKSIRNDGRLYSNMSQNGTTPHPDGARQTTLMVMSKSADQNRPSAKGISFPRSLPDRFIRQYTNPGDLVLDPFCGVGTTLKVASILGRESIGFEIDPAEADRAREWLAEPIQRPLIEAVL